MRNFKVSDDGAKYFVSYFTKRLGVVTTTMFRNFFLLPSLDERRGEAYFVGPVRDLRLALPGNPTELASLLLSPDDRSRSDFHSLWL
jgi:hypothetical protein